MEEMFLAIDRIPRDIVDCENPSHYLSLLDTDEKLEFLNFLHAAKKCSDAASDYLKKFGEDLLRKIFQRKFYNDCLQNQEASQFVAKQLAHCPASSTPNPILPNSTTQLNYPELSAAFGHAIVNGIFNASSQQLSAYLNNKGYTGSRIKTISLSLIPAIAHSAYAALLPIILVSLQNSNTENDEQTNEIWERFIQQVIPIFFTNMAFSVFLQSANCFQKNYLAPSSIGQKLVRSIPTVSTAWAAMSNPIAATTNFIISAASSFATLTLSNYLFSKPAASQEKFETNTLAHADAKEKNKLEDFLPKKPQIYQYITSSELTKIQTEISEIINKLEALQKSLEAEIDTIQKQCQKINIPALLKSSEEIITSQSRILGIVKSGLERSEPLKDMLNDDIHQEACKEHTDRGQYVAAMEKLGNVFKLNQAHYLKMVNELNSAIGIVEGSYSNFDKSTKDELNEITNVINFLLSKIGLRISIYSTADVAEKAKNEGLKEGVNETLQKILSTTPPSCLFTINKPSHRPYSEVPSYTSQSSSDSEQLSFNEQQSFTTCLLRK